MRREGHVMRREEGHVMRREEAHVMRREEGHVMRREEGHVMRREEGHVMRREEGHVMRREEGHVLRRMSDAPTTGKTEYRVDTGKTRECDRDIWKMWGSVACRLTGCRLRGIGLVTVVINGPEGQDWFCFDVEKAHIWLRGKLGSLATQSEKNSIENDRYRGRGKASH